MSAPVDVASTISTLAVIVRLHEGNRDAKVNALLECADSCGAAVAELIEAAPALHDYLEGYLYWQREQGEDPAGLDIAAFDIARFRAALARVGGAA